MKPLVIAALLVAAPAAAQDMQQASPGVAAAVPAKLSLADKAAALSAAAAPSIAAFKSLQGLFKKKAVAAPPSADAPPPTAAAAH